MGVQVSTAIHYTAPKPTLPPKAPWKAPLTPPKAKPLEVKAAEAEVSVESLAGAVIAAEKAKEDAARTMQERKKELGEASRAKENAILELAKANKEAAEAKAAGE